jgi:hypothetical protein
MKRDLLLILVIFALGLWQNLHDVHVSPFHPDESRWLHRAAFAGELRHPLGSFWDDEQTMRVQPPLGSYLMGVGLLVQGRDLETNGAWNFRHGRLWNIVNGNMPSDGDLAAGRRTNAAVGALTAAVLFMLGRLLMGRVAGAAAGLFFASHPLSILMSSQALSDALLTLLVALAALIAVLLAERPTWVRAVLLGIVLGLGAATKLSPFLVSLPLAALGGLLLVRARGGRAGAGASWRADARLGWRLLPLPLIAAATFIAVFPYLWSDPIGRTSELVEFRTQEMANQGDIWENLAVDSRTEALRRVGVTLGDRFSTTGWIASRVARVVGLSWHPSGIDLPLALIGIEMLAFLAIARGLRASPTVLAVVLGSQAGAIVLGMRADFARYHLPIVLAAAVGVGFAVDAFWQIGSRLARFEWSRNLGYALLDRVMPSDSWTPAVPLPVRVARNGHLPHRIPLPAPVAPVITPPPPAQRESSLVEQAT